MDFGQVKYHSKMNNDFKVNCQQMLDWIKETGLQANQIVSINTNLVSLAGEKHMLTCFYYESAPEDSESLENLEFFNANTNSDWEDQTEKVEEELI